MENREEFKEKIYTINTTETDREKIQVAVKMNSDFLNNPVNIEKIIDCEDVLTILKEYNIPYKVQIEGLWTENSMRRKTYNPYAQVCFYIRSEDYEYYKSILIKEVENDSEITTEEMLEEDINELNDSEQENKMTEEEKREIIKQRNLAVTLFSTVVGIILLIVGISYLNKQNISSGGVLTILALFFIYNAIKTNMPQKDNNGEDNNGNIK